MVLGAVRAMYDNKRVVRFTDGLTGCSSSWPLASLTCMRDLAKLGYVQERAIATRGPWPPVRAPPPVFPGACLGLSFRPGGLAGPLLKFDLTCCSLPLWANCLWTVLSPSAPGPALLGMRFGFTMYYVPCMHRSAGTNHVLIMHWRTQVPRYPSTSVPRYSSPWKMNISKMHKYPMCFLCYCSVIG